MNWGWAQYDLPNENFWKRFFSFILCRHWLWLSHRIMLCDKTYLHNFDPSIRHEGRENFHVVTVKVFSFLLRAEYILLSFGSRSELRFITFIWGAHHLLYRVCVRIYMFSTHGRRPFQIKYKKLLCLCRDRKTSVRNKQTPKSLLWVLSPFTC